MSIDLKVMRPGKLAGLLNSTRLGEVTSEPRVRRNIIRAGLRVGDSTRVNVLAYAAWLVAAWHARRGLACGGEGLSGYDALRESAAALMLGVSLFRGATPKKVKPKRKHVAYL